MARSYSSITRTALLSLSVAALFSACVLDFGKFEGEEASGGSGTGTGVGGSGTGTGTGTGTPSGGEGGSGGMVPVECTNMMQDGAETDVDCGGDSCPGCDNGDMCNTFSDCVSQFCSAGTCAACTGNPDCADAPNTFCNSGLCIEPKDNGETCTAAVECQSNFCVDGLCCESACGGVCEACSATLTSGTDGTCEGILGATDPDNECNGTDVCDGASSCAAFCGLKPTPPGGMCPAACTGGCAGTTCVVNCNASGACQNDVINCPAGFACEVSCNGNDGCNSATINCPEGMACDISCNGQAGCRNAVINCSATGVCEVSCGSTNQVCRDAVISCGDNACSTTCASAQFPPTSVCGGSCMCTTCP